VKGNNNDDETLVNIFMGARNLEEATAQTASHDFHFENSKNNKPTSTLETKLISMKQVARLWNRLNIHSN
jgi:hypothetical protein